MILIYIYSILLIIAILTWLSAQKSNNTYKSLLITVIVVVRNEEKNIIRLLESIKQQTHKNFEVIIVDDQSTDQTAKLIQEFNLDNLKLISLSTEERGSSPKKAGIEKAIGLANGRIIYSTDGDCVLPPEILEIYAENFSNPKIQFIAGPVTFFNEKTLWNKLQTVEFSSLIGTAAIAFFLKKPIMSSAANLAYRKEAFLAVNGYDGNKSLASGDDEFLMNKINQHFPCSSLFIKDKNCIVKTSATKNIQHFYQQRKRWASKWSSSINWASILTAIFIFAVNAATIYYMVTGSWNLLIIRYVPEAIFLAIVLWFLDRKDSIIFIPLTQVLYPFYAVFFGLISLKPKNYQWKNRDLH